MCKTTWTRLTAKQYTLSAEFKDQQGDGALSEKKSKPALQVCSVEHDAYRHDDHSKASEVQSSMHVPPKEYVKWDRRTRPECLGKAVRVVLHGLLTRPLLLD